MSAPCAEKLGIQIQANLQALGAESWKGSQVTWIRNPETRAHPVDPCLRFVEDKSMANEIKIGVSEWNEVSWRSS